MMAAGCGSSTRHHASTSAGARTTPAAADPTAVEVIRAWSTALRRGDLNAAARYFALPSEFVNGPAVIAIHTEAQARIANASLPCGAVLVSTSRRGRFVSALFRLTNRVGAGGACGSGAGQLARTNFVIADGHIVDWIRAPNPGGGAPPTTPGGGPIV
jgi:limonene-1,2-epoxide hydrolase